MKRVSSLLLLLLATAACTVSRGTPPDIVLPASLASAEPIAAERRVLTTARNPMKLGDWQVTEHRRGWTRNTDSSWRPVVRPIWAPPVSLAFEKARTKYSFEVGNPAGAEWESRCALLDEADALRVGRSENGIPTEGRRTLACELRQGENAWALNFSGTTRIRLGHVDRLGGGELTDGTRSIELKPVFHMVKVPIASGIPVGYIFRDDSGDLAAVEVLPPGRVRFATSTSAADRELIAAAATALLLAPDPSVD